ncbi:hypothetical protein AB0M00_40550 [Streptomyces chartreusis]|uniref:hypothetical protein n=1 Tax=Streptomyces TaxID=1883 RepID=UPI00343BFEFF
MGTAEDVGRGQQKFFRGVVSEQTLQPIREMPEALALMTVDGCGHCLAQKILGCLSQSCCLVPDDPADGVADGHVEQDLASPVRVVGGHDIDGQLHVQQAAEDTESPARALGLLNYQEPGEVCVRGQRNSTASPLQFAGCGRPGQRDLDGVVGCHF